MKKLVLAVVVLALLASAIPLGFGVSTASADTGTKWAILISGGLNPQENDAAFWNDIGETYKILITKYGYAPADVFVLYANGNPPTAANCHSYYLGDEWIWPYPYPTIIDYSATSANLQTVCQYIADHDGPTDTLYVYLTDHGTGSSEFCLWGEVINAPTFGSYVNLINNISWRCFVMDFCHSGGFKNFPDPVPTAIAFSCRADQVCYTGDNGYGVFTYYFNAALRGCIADYAPHHYYPFEYLNLVDADYNDDGKVTIKEAHNYAYNRTTSEYYSSTPWIAMSSTLLGEVLVLGQPFNDAPVADAGGPGYYSGAAGAPITFDGSSSFDSDGTIISYQWDFGDASTGSGVAPAHAYSHEGFYTATLTVWDDDYGHTSRSVGVRVGSEVITCDAAGNQRQWFGPGETVYVKGTWFEPNTPYWMWIQDDLVLEGDALVSGEDPSGSQEKVTTALEDGSFGPVGIWTVPSTSTSVGYRVYDVVVDAYPAKYSTRYDGLASFSAITEAPAAVIDGFSVDEDSQLTVAAPGVLGNDYDRANRPLTAATVSGPSHGTLTLNLDGSFTYRPDANFNGADSFTYTANYGEFTSNTAAVTITVRSVDDAPVSVNDEYTTNEDTVLTVNVPGVLANDTDVEGDPLTVTVLHRPEWGEITLKPDGYFVYTPKRGFSGVDSFTYWARDPEGLGSDVAMATINVISVNDAPVAGSDSYSVEAGKELVVDAPGVLANDTDVEGDKLTAVLLQKTAYGDLDFHGEDGSFSYSPEGDFNGEDSFIYVAHDGQAFSRKSVVTIKVTPAGSGLTVANPIPDRTATEDAAFSYTFPADTYSVANAGDTLTYTAWLAGGDPLPAWLSFDAAARTFSGTPDNGDVGVITVTVTATDQNLASAADSFDITVTNVNDAPTVASPIPDQTATEEVDFSYTLSAYTFNDVDAGDSLTYAATLAGGSPLPGWLSFDAAVRRFTGTPANADVGVITVTVTAADQHGASASDSFDIAVINVNDAPTLANRIPPLEEPEGRDFTYALPVDTFEDVDPGDSLTYSAELVGSEGLPKWLDFDAETATFYGSPDFDSAKDYKIAVTATDGKGESVSTAFLITVLNVNRPPELQGIPGSQTDSEGESVYLRIQVSDLDGDTIQFRATGLPPDLTFDDATGVISGTWGYDSAGSYIVAITVSDGESRTFVVIPWTVNEANRPPQITNPGDQTSTEGDSVSLQIVASDPDGDALNFGATGLPSDLAIDAATGVIAGTLGDGSAGSYTVTVTVSDGDASTGVTFAWTVNAENTNRPPVAVNDSATTNEGTPVTIDVLANDSDPDGDPLIVVLVSGPSHGTLALNADGSFTYEPDAKYNGADTFTYVANDGTADSNVATVTIMVTGETSILLSPTEAVNAVGTEHTVTATVQDYAGNPIAGLDVTFTITTGPNAGLTGTVATDGNGEATFTYSSAAEGTDIIQASCVDDAGATLYSNEVTKTWQSYVPPVPELSTMVLFGVGLFLLSGLVFLAKRRAAAA